MAEDEIGKDQKSIKGKNGVLILTITVFIITVMFSIILVKKYAPSKEKMPLNDYFGVKGKGCAVVLNGKLMKPYYAIVSSDRVYLSLDFIKSNLDDGYVYDSDDKILRYATDRQIISVAAGDDHYYSDKEYKKAEAEILVEADGEAYLDLEWIKKYTDFESYVKKDPSRVILSAAGWKYKTAAVKSDTYLRRHGGVKSPILGTVKKGEKVIILENYGKWKFVQSEDGIQGCLMSKTLEPSKTVTVKKSLPKRKYSHTKFKGKVCLLWHQLTNANANSSIDKVLSTRGPVNVISPTWYSLSDNNGNISDISDTAYVNKCHSAGVQVWGLVSNFGKDDVDSTLVLNSTTKRDALIGNILAAAIKSDLDGINIDFESLSKNAQDGYIEFIRELALKCRKNDIILSVDNYKPTGYTQFYNRKVQADYADYVVLMAYDEHYSGSKKAGSNSSISFVKTGISDTLKEVPEDELILALPFYTRVFTVNSSNAVVSSKALGMKAASDLVESWGTEKTWDEKKGQYFASVENSDGTKSEVWLEDARSLGLKLDEMKENKLAGAAFWKSGFETSDIWDTVTPYIN